MLQPANEFTDLHKLLAQKLAAAHYSIDTFAQEQITHYLLLLSKWSHSYNLTGIYDPEKMITHHILDSLSIMPYIQGEKILDVGTGAGLPGIPLALVAPKCAFTLLDSNGKKTRFLTHVVQTLNISNVEVVQARVEKFKSQNCFDSIIARAFSSLANFVSLARHLCCSNGYFLAMKGNYPHEELKQMNTGHTIMVYDLQVAGLDGKRHLVAIKNIAPGRAGTQRARSSVG